MRGACDLGGRPLGFAPRSPRHERCNTHLSKNTFRQNATEDVRICWPPPANLTDICAWEGKFFFFFLMTSGMSSSQRRPDRPQFQRVQLRCWRNQKKNVRDIVQQLTNALESASKEHAPIHTEYFHSGGATTWNMPSVPQTCAHWSLGTRMAPDGTTLAYKFCDEKGFRDWV